MVNMLHLSLGGHIPLLSLVTLLTCSQKVADGQKDTGLSVQLQWEGI